MGKKIVLKKPFETKSTFDLSKVRKDAFGIFIGHKKHKVKVLFDKLAAPYVAEKKWNPSQKTRPKSDGSLIFEIVVCDLIEIKAWILSWGSHAKVLAPQELIKEIKTELAKSIDSY